MSFLRHALLFCLPGLLLAVPAEEKKAPAPGTVLGAEDVRGGPGFYGVVFYYSPDPAADPSETARSLAKEILPGVPVVTVGHEPEKPPFLTIEEEKAPLKDYPVPDGDYFKYFGRGLKAEDVAAIRKTSRATVLVLISPQEDVWRLGRSFTVLAHAYAEKTKAAIWDSATRECFSRAAWQEKRITPWPEKGLPPLASQVTMHIYRPEGSEDFARIITLGMEKFALPDLVIERISNLDGARGGNLINLICQSLAQNPRLHNGAKEIFKVTDIDPGPARESFVKLKLGKATGQIALAMLEGKPQDGDPDNRLLELDFRYGEGASENEKRDDLLSKFWGTKDSVVGVKEDEELLAASRQAKAKLPELNERFARRAELTETLLVKAPFPRDDKGQEWMWVEVQRWPKGGDIDGILENDPYYIKRLRSGALVHVKTADVFDYILKKRDGTQEGNETGKIIEKQGGPVQEK